MSPTIGALALAMSKAQGTMRNAVKESENPFFKSKYADLAAVLDACRGQLAANGLTVMQPVSASGSAVTVTTLLAHESGEWVSSDLTVTAKDQTPQSIGSATSYARRYGLSAMLGIGAEDDDGNAAQPRDDKPSPADRATKAKAEKKQSGSTLIPGALNTQDSATVAALLAAITAAKSLKLLEAVYVMNIKPNPDAIRYAVKAAYEKRERELDDLPGDLGSQVGADEAAAIRQREAEEARRAGP